MILSVVIPTKDKRPLLARTLAALQAQDLGDEAWEIVVVNDDSVDDTPFYLAEAAAAPASRVKIVTPARNVGRAAARNLGWSAARGHWVVFLDDDIVAPPGLLSAHLRVLRADERTGTIGPVVTDPEIADAPHFYYLDTRGVAKLPPGDAPAKYFVTQNAAVPRRALEAVGGFDEGFAAYGFEDMDLGFKLEDWGVRFKVLPAPVPLHIHHHTLDQYLEKKRICGCQSLREIARRHPHRLAEMHLDLIVDSENTLPGLKPRFVRALLDGWPARTALAMLRAWPEGDELRPRWPRIYCRFMDAAVLSAFRQGLRDT